MVCGTWWSLHHSLPNERMNERMKENSAQNPCSKFYILAIFSLEYSLLVCVVKFCILFSFKRDIIKNFPYSYIVEIFW